jgi:rod shape-determining protein MreC
MALSRRGTRSSRTRFTLLLLVLTSITLLTLDFRGFGPVESARNAVLSAFAPVGDGAAAVVRPIGNVWSGAFDYGDLEERNKELQQRVDEVQGQKAGNENAQKELDQLKAQLDIPFVGPLESVTAHVANGAIGNFEDTVEIDKGSSDKIQVGMPVISGSGLVGKVVRVADNRSVVKLITNRDFNVGVKVPNKLGVGIAKGTGEERHLTAEFNSKDAQVDVNDVLVTSGSKDSPYPAEIPVGKVTNVVQSDDVELRKSLDVELSTNLKDVTYLSVVLYTPPPS